MEKKENSKKIPSDFLPIVNILNKYFSPDLFLDLEYPDSLTGDYQDFSEEKKKDWYFHTFHEICGSCSVYVAEKLKRSLTKSEIGFIKDRVEGFIKNYLHSMT